MRKCDKVAIVTPVFLSLLGVLTFPVVAAEIMSCKLAGDAMIGSDKAYSYSLYGESDDERRVLSMKNSKVLTFENRDIIRFGGNDFERMPSSVGWHEVYDGGYWGFAQLYDYREEEGAATLVVFRTNGYNSQKSNFVAVELWHCNR